MICSLIGNRDCPSSVKQQLESTLIQLITQKHATLFYVGNHGRFDQIAASVLKNLKRQFPEIQYYVVLAYLSENALPHPTLLADGMEHIPPRYRIVHRNKWMVRQSDVLICYKLNIAGNARAIGDYAENLHKQVIYL